MVIHVVDRMRTASQNRPSHILIDGGLMIERSRGVSPSDGSLVELADETAPSDELAQPGDENAPVPLI